jgi:hypothetical protein
MPVEEVIAWLEKAGGEDALQVRLSDAELYEEFGNWLKPPAKKNEMTP